MQVGNFYLADKEGGQAFTREDEEVLALFASQAGAAIANARRHRAEQRARADLEALVDTSPVGVVVFDARTGHPVSLNREAKRIVGGLCLPDRSPEQLLEVLSWRRADGREISMATSPLQVVICMMTTSPPKTIVKPTALGPVANTDTKLLIYGLFRKGRVLAQDAQTRQTLSAIAFSTARTASLSKELL